MIFVDLLAAFFLLVILVAKETSAARYLHNVVVLRLAAKLESISAGHLFSFAAVILVAGLLIWLAKADGFTVVSMGAPDIASWFMTFEVTTYTDALVAVLVASSVVRMKAIKIHVLGKIRSAITMPNAGRVRRARSRRTRPMPAANDDEGGFLHAA